MKNWPSYPYQQTSLVMMAIGAIFLFSAFYAYPTSTNYGSNPASAKIELGRWLFFDHRLSYNQQKSCASCHDPRFCFSDGYRTSAGTDGFNVKHNAPSLINAVFLQQLTWADSSMHQLTQQMRNPMFNEDPRELGIKGNERLVLQRIQLDAYYQKAFKAAFPGLPDPINLENVITSIAAYESILTSFNSKYDRFLKGDSTALNQTELAGLKLYQSEQLQCAHCHDKPTLSQNQELVYANTGLYNLKNSGAYPDNDQGLFECTKKESDRGKFRIPSLRNVMLTAPYTHNGAIQTIAEMIEIYASAGRTISEGPFQGDGRKHPNKSSLIKGFQLNAVEKTQLIAFLNALTDTSNLQSAYWKDPF